MILSDKKILEGIEKGDIIITPFYINAIRNTQDPNTKEFTAREEFRKLKNSYNSGKNIYIKIPKLPTGYIRIISNNKEQSANNVLNNEKISEYSAEYVLAGLLTGYYDLE